tara:strand:- start:38 stop:505 length:468 start_codon:yes stop_codon:yes gene_type:complete
MESWIIYALITLFLTGAFNTYMEYAGKSFVKGQTERIIYFSLFFALGGLLSLVNALYLMKSNPKAFSNVLYEMSFPYSKLLIPGIILPIAMFLNMIALSKGGGIAMTIINLNMLVTIFAGAWFLGDKIDLTIVGCTLIALIFIAIATYRSIQINK